MSALYDRFAAMLAELPPEQAERFLEALGYLDKDGARSAIRTYVEADPGARSGMLAFVLSDGPEIARGLNHEHLKKTEGVPTPADLAAWFGDEDPSRTTLDDVAEARESGDRLALFEAAARCPEVCWPSDEGPLPSRSELLDLVADARQRLADDEWENENDPNAERLEEELSQATVIADEKLLREVLELRDKVEELSEPVFCQDCDREVPRG